MHAHAQDEMVQLKREGECDTTSRIYWVQDFFNGFEYGEDYLTVSGDVRVVKTKTDDGSSMGACAAGCRSVGRLGCMRRGRIRRWHGSVRLSRAPQAAP